MEKSDDTISTTSQKYVSINGHRTPIPLPNTVEKHFMAIRDEINRLEQQKEANIIVVSQLQSKIVDLKKLVMEYKQKWEQAEETLRKIKEHLL